MMATGRWLLVLGLLVAAHTPVVGDDEALVPIGMPDGQTVYAELAMAPEDRARGLMFRDGLPEGQGMLLVFEHEGDRRITMRNMRFDLDVLFLDPNGRILEIAEGVAHPKHAADTISQVWGQGQYVLELPAGATRHHHLAVGNVLKFLRPTGGSQRVLPGPVTD